MPGRPGPPESRSRMFERLAAPKHVPVIHKDEELKWASGGDEDDEDDTAGNEETKQLLIELHNKFVECDEDENGEMDEKEFIGIRDLWLSKVDHKEMTPAQLRHLFLKIDTNCDGGLAWAEVSTSLLLFGSDETEEARGGAPALVPTVEPPAEPSGVARYHRGSITRCLYHQPSGRWVTTSVDGTFRIWNKQMHLLRTERPLPRKPPPPRSRRHQGHVPEHPKPPTPISGGCFCGGNQQWLALVEVDRRITFYDVSSCARIGSIGGSMTTDRMVCVPALDAPSNSSRGYFAHKPETHGCGCPYDADATGIVPTAEAKARLHAEMTSLSWSDLQERALSVGLGKSAIAECGVRTMRAGGLAFQQETDTKETRNALIERIMSIELIPSRKTVGKPFEELPKTWHCLNCGAARDRFEKEVPDTPLCCASWKGAKGTNFLAVGDTGGALSIYKLRHNDEEEGNAGNDRPGLLAGIDFSNEASLSSGNSRDPLRVELFYRRRAAMDDDWITAIKYLPDQGRLAYSSRDGTLQLFSLTRLEEDVPTLLHTDTFGVPARDGVGIRAFDWSPAQRWFATCGPSRAVLLWSTHDTSTPQKILDGHSAVTTDVVMVDSRQQLISLAVDKVIKVWDMRTLAVSQTLSLDPANLFENNIPAMVWSNDNGGCLVGGCMRLARWDPAVGDTPAVTLLSKATEVPHSHRTPLISVRYIPGLQQVVSIDKTGRTKIWDAESAELLFAYNGDHATGTKEGRQPALTACALDVERRRAISAAEDGTVCVWNPNAGVLLNRFLPAPASRQRVQGKSSQARATSKSMEVRAVTYWPEMHHFIAVGWSRSLLCYSDQQNYGQSVTPNWVGKRHKADIMCVALRHPFVATGGLDGMLVIWKATSVREIHQSQRLCTVRRTIAYTEYGLPDANNRGLNGIVPGAASEELAIEAAIFGTLRSHRSAEAANSSEKLRQHAQKTAATNDILLTGHGDGCIRVWDTKVWEVRVWWRASTIDDQIVNGVAPTGLPHSVNNLAIDPAGEVVYSTSAGAITAWSVALLELPARRKFSWDRSVGSGRGDEIVPMKLSSWQVTTSPLKGIALLDDLPSYLVSADAAGDAVLWTCTGERVGLFGGTDTWDLRNRELPEFTIPHTKPKEGKSLKQRQAAIAIQLFYKARLQRLKKTRGLALGDEAAFHSNSRPPTSGSSHRPTTAVSFADTADSERMGIYAPARPVTAASIQSEELRPGTSGGRSDAVTPVRDPSFSSTAGLEAIRTSPIKLTPIPPAKKTPSSTFSPTPPGAAARENPTLPKPNKKQRSKTAGVLPARDFDQIRSVVPGHEQLLPHASSTSEVDALKKEVASAAYTNPAAKLASVQALHIQRTATRGTVLEDLRTTGSSTDRLHRAMTAMQSPRSQTVCVRLHRPTSRDYSNSASSLDRHRLNTLSSTPSVKEVLYTPRRSSFVKKLLDPALLGSVREQAAMCTHTAAADGIAQSNLPSM